MGKSIRQNGLNVCHVSVDLRSCDADVDISVSLTGRGIILRLASILLGSNAVTSTLSTGIEEGVSICLFLLRLNVPVNNTPAGIHLATE